MSNIHFTLAQLQQIAKYLLKHLHRLCQEWARIHG
jgi:hypothetical protein